MTGEELGSSATLRRYSEQTGGPWCSSLRRAAALTRFTAHWQDGEMKLAGEVPIGWFRGRSHDIRKESVRREGERSGDGGTWQLAIEARRRR